VGDADADGAFIGRHDELTRLATALGRAGAGGGRTIVIGGEAGIGKTHLIERFATDARMGGAQVLVGACIEFGGQGVPFAPFVEALRRLFREVEPGRVPATFGPGRRGLARLLPELDERPSDAPPATEPDRSGQARLFELVLEMVERISRATPVLLIVEDLQWADADTRDLITFLVRHLRSARVLTVLTVRTDDSDHADRLLPYLAELERDDWVERLDLRSFDRAEVGRLLTIGVGQPPSADLLNDILARSGGNPFYAEQLMAMVQGNGGQEGTLPQRLQDVLEARLSVLPAAALETVRAAAAAGQRIDDAMLLAGIGTAYPELTAALRVAVDRDVLVSVDQSRGGAGGFTFRHPLLQEVAYRQLLPGERVHLHGRYAAHLAARRTEDPGITASELAFHLDGARQYGEAVPALIEAGGVAERAFAFGQAGQFYQRALALMDGSVAHEEIRDVDRIRVMQRAAECALLTGRHQRAMELGGQAIALLEGTDQADAGRLVTLQERYRWYLWESGDQAAAEVAVAEALERIPSAPPSTARARALAQAAGLRMEAGDVTLAIRLAEEAIALARTVHAPAEEALAGGILGWCQAISGDVDLGTQTYRDALAIAERLGGAEGVALGHANLAALLDRVGRTEASLAVALEGYAVVRRLGVSRTYGGALLGQAAKALFDLGRWPEALATADEGLDLDPVGRAAIELHLARARIDASQGRTTNAAAHLARARVLSDTPGLESSYGPSLVAGEADLARREGRYDQVRAAVDEGIGYVADDRPLDPALGWLAETALGAEADIAARARARNDGPALAEAEARSERIIAMVRRAAGTPAASVDSRRDGLLALCEAEARRASGKAASADWAQVADLWTTRHRPHAAAYARFREGEAVLGLRGDRAAAAVALREAHASASHLGATSLRIQIEELAGHARIDLRGASEVSTDRGARDGSNTFDLTDREAEVIRLVAAGWSNQQIADALFITRKTASVHVSNILGKFGVRNRGEAAAIAHRLGMVADTPPSQGA
jgi:DNA-binding CsgD family transcriptional regulator/tetratricopeptide (TPR) repeat protein